MRTRCIEIIRTMQKLTFGKESNWIKVCHFFDGALNWLLAPDWFLSGHHMFHLNWSCHNNPGAKHTCPPCCLSNEV